MAAFLRVNTIIIQTVIITTTTFQWVRLEAHLEEGVVGVVAEVDQLQSLPLHSIAI